MQSSANEKIYRYELQESARELYRRYNVDWDLKGLVSCCRFAPTKELSVKITNDGTIYLNGLNHCNSRSSCPVCAYPMQLKTLNEIEHAIWLGRKAGHGVYLITYTFSHGVGDNLSMIQDMFSEAKQMMYRDKSYREIMKYYGYVGRITDYEIQICGKNGFHPHTHDLEFLDEDINLKEIQDIYADYWLKCLEAVGLSAKKDITVKVLGYKGVGDYITKMGCEISLGSFTKYSRSEYSLSPFQCLTMYHETKNDFYGLNWIEYVCNIKRKRIIGWSRGLRDYLGVRQFDEVNESDTWEEGDFPLMVFDDYRDIEKLKPWQWRTLKESLQVGNLEIVEDVLKMVRISYHFNKFGLKRYHDLV